MRRTLFTLTALCAAAAGFAQSPLATVGNVAPAMKPAPAVMKLDAAKQVNNNAVVQRNVANGNYYLAPSGSMFYGFDKQGSGFYQFFVNTQAFSNAVFQNMNADPFSATWTYNGYRADELGLVDENNNFVWSGSPSVSTAQGFPYYYLPVLVGASDSYSIPNGMGSNYGGGIVSMGEIAPLTFTDDHIGNSIVGFAGFIDTQYLFGKGVATIQAEDGTTTYMTINSVAQHFDAPMSPLYVEDVYVQAISANMDETPLKNGAELTMIIVGENSGNRLAELTLTQDDLSLMSQQQISGTNWGVACLWNAIFSNKVVDPVFGEMAEPFVIDEPFTIIVTGFDNPDVNLGFYGYQSNESVDYPYLLQGGELIGTDNATGEEISTGYQGNLAIPFTFSSMMDNIRVSTTLYYQDEAGNLTPIDYTNVIRIPEDGSAGYMEATGDPGAYVYTASDWESGYYTTEIVSSSDNDAENWLGAASVDNSLWSSSDNAGLNLVSFTATPISSDQGRWAIVNITGRGVTSADPIIVLQGTATLEDVAAGIDNVVVGNNNAVKNDPNAPVYNLNGQRVSKDTKGILIQNGKKFINK